MRLVKMLSGAAIAALIAGQAAAFDPANMTQTERTAFRDAVRAYLLDNPEVLMEAMEVLENRRADMQASQDVTLIQQNQDALYNAGDWVGGNPDGDIRIVEFIDYRCGYCKQAHPEMSDLLKQDGNIRLVVKELPVLGEQSVTAARFAIAARTIGGDQTYGQINDTLMAYRGPITRPALEKIATTFGLDWDALQAEMGSEATTKVIGDTLLLAQRLGVRGTPGFVIEDQILRGYVPAASMEKIIAELRAKG